MNSKERYEFRKKLLPNIYKQTEEEVIFDLVNRLIECLYKPVPNESMFVRDANRCELFNVGEEAINWGDLKCNEVKKFEDGTYLVTIDEASPGNCETFCDYIEKYMKAWGWECVVQTEW